MREHEKHLAKAGEELEVASYLLEGDYHTAAASKAYYSMYHAAKALLSMKQIYPRSHGGVISQFGLEFVKKGFIEESHGHALAHAKDRREIADYDIEKEISKESAEETVRDAERFLERIKKAVIEIEE